MRLSGVAGVLAGLLAIIAGVGACSAPTEKVPAAEGTLKVVSSFSILSDMVSEIGGERVSVHNLVPLGTDPHEYEPLPEDLKRATDADLLLYSGLNLEGGDDGWFFKLADAVQQPPERIFEMASRVEPLYISEGNGQVEVNPHGFVSPAIGIVMAENVRDALIATDPANADHYRRNAEAYIEALEGLDEQYRGELGAIPEGQRIIVTSERAFQYLAEEYGLKEGYIWAIDTEENGSPEQIKGLVDFVRANNVHALLVESNVDRRPMETVSSETGVPIVGTVLSDEVGEPSEEGGTYLKFLEHNLDVITEALGSGWQ